MKKIILILTFINLVIFTTAQESDIDVTFQKPKNSIYISYGGAGIFFSAIYERHFIKNKSYSFGIKGGIGNSFSLVLFPNEFNFQLGGLFIYGKRKHHLDVSLNLTNYIIEQYDYYDNKIYKELKILYVPSICYRYQKQEGGVVGKIGLSSIININSTTNSVSPWIDISLGWAF